MTKECFCCHKEFISKPTRYKRIFCDNCAKKVKKQIHKRRMKQYPLFPWKWNMTTVYEVDNIVEELQKVEE